MLQLSLVEVDPEGPEALGLLREAAREARALYPEELDPGAPWPTNGPTPPGGVYLLACSPQAPLGCGALRPLGGTVAEVRRVFVTQSARRCGIARLVLRELEARARRMGYSTLRLETGYKQIAAMRLYEGMGYVRIEPFGPYVGDPASVCFEKSLEQGEASAGRDTPAAAPAPSGRSEQAARPGPLARAARLAYPAPPMHHGSCHCGAVTLTLPSTPEVATSCNCSLCRRIGGPWVYYEFGTVRIEGHPENTLAYIQGDRTLRTIRCRTCGCVTHWEPIDPHPGARHGVHLGNFDPALLAAVKVRRFDGADTWTFFDEAPPSDGPAEAS